MRREPTEFLENLGRRIRERRQALGWSLDDVAERGDFSKAGLWQIEHGQSSPRANTVYRLCLLLGISPNKLLLGVEKFE